MNREFLLTKFVCAKCGDTLSLTYDVPKGAGSYSEGQPTGAAMVAMNVAIEPCHKCMQPLYDMQRAAKTILECAK